jgi:hypothetical protein
MQMIEVLAEQPHVYEGPGTNHEGERFLGHLEASPLVNAKSVLLHYTATREDGKPFTGRARCYWSVCTAGADHLRRLPHYFAYTPAEYSAFVLQNYLVLFGMPYAAFYSYYLVSTLEASHGPIEVEFVGLMFKGAAGSLAFWLLVSLSVQLGFKMCWLGNVLRT